MIPARPLGRTGVTAPALGFGVSGPHATRLLTSAETTRLIGQALELGVGVFDTAPIYGDGEAERRLGLALDSADRDRVFVSTKAGLVGRDAKGTPRRDFSVFQIRHSIYWSLKRLGLAHVDAYLLHGPGPEELSDELIDALQGLKAAGACRFVGVCGRGDELIAAARLGVFDLAMLPVHANLDADGQARLDTCRGAGLGILGIETLSPALPRFKSIQSAGDLWYNARRVIRGGGQGPPTLAPDEALRRALAPGRADVAVITTTRPEHLRANVAAVAAASAPSQPLEG